jgi:hypothetical protein
MRCATILRDCPWIYAQHVANDDFHHPAIIRVFYSTARTTPYMMTMHSATPRQPSPARPSATNAANATNATNAPQSRALARACRFCRTRKVHTHDIVVSLAKSERRNVTLGNRVVALAPPTIANASIHTNPQRKGNTPWNTVQHVSMTYHKSAQTFHPNCKCAAERDLGTPTLYRCAQACFA